MSTVPRITLSPELSERVWEVARRHNTTPEALLVELLGPPWQDDLDEVAAVREALAQAQQGRHRSVEEWAADFENRNTDRRPGNGNRSL